MTDELMSEIKVPRTDGSIITVVGVGGAGGSRYLSFSGF